MNNQINPVEKVNRWVKNSVGLKLGTITILMLLLLIPAAMIKSIIREREALSESVLQEVSSKWANSQHINGPVLCIPFLYDKKISDEKIIEKVDYIYVLPDDLQITGNVSPEKRKRGIYEVIVYRSKLLCKGEFKIKNNFNLQKAKKICYQDAFLTIGISDLRGVASAIQIKWGKENLSVEPGSKIIDLIESGVTAYLPNLEKQIDAPIPFSFELEINGSRNLSFVPVGKQSKVELQSNWPDPSFNGNYIPKESTVNESGFTANWTVLQLNRNYPQWWIGKNMQQQMKESTFGVDLLSSMTDYQKSTRSAKYAAMTIALVFLIFFLVEILNHIRIHPFQYILVGLTLCLFYVLLISISEHSNFNLAYLIASFISCVMISLYSKTVFKSNRFTLLLMGTIAAIYVFVFITLQQADYALLIGSIGLTIVLAITMYSTRNIDWYRFQSEKENE
jgi:inner membrane protein